MRMLNILFFSFIAIVLCSNAEATILNQFNDSSSSGNITWYENTNNQTRFVEIPKGAIINNATITLRNVVVNNFTYREEANKYDGCFKGSNWTEIDVVGYCAMNDSDWDTPDNVDIPGTAKFYANYTKYSVEDEILWRIGYQNMSGGTYIEKNLTIPTECDLTTLQFLIISESYFPVPNYRNSTWFCHNGSEWKQQFEFAWPVIIEEGIYANSTFNLTNLEISLNGTLIYNLTGQFNTSSQVIDLNTSLLQDVIASNDNAELKFKSDNGAIMEYTNLQIGYTPNASADVIVDDPVTWSISMNSDGTIDKSWEVNNTGSADAENCTATISDATMSGFTSFSPSSFVISAGASQSVTATLTQPTASGIGYLNVQCDNAGVSGGAVNTPQDPGIILTTTILSGGVSGGDIGVSGPCNIEILKPYNNKIVSVGSQGRTSSWRAFVVENNNTQADQFKFSVFDVDCEVADDTAEIGAGSKFTNYVRCSYGDTDGRENGALNITSSFCTRTIEVSVETGILGNILNSIYGLVVGGNVNILGVSVNGLVLLFSGLIIFMGSLIGLKMGGLI